VNKAQEKDLQRRKAVKELVEKLGAVFPVFGVTKSGACQCKEGPACTNIGKHPIWWLVRNGHTEATRDLGVIWEWFSRARRYGMNIGLVANQDWFALDIDPKSGGEESLAKLEAQFGPLPKTVTSRTGSNGQHRLFKAPKDGRRVQNKANTLGPEFPGLDTRAGGQGYIVAPPSEHKSGNLYRWEEGLGPSEVELAEAPEWLLAMVVAKPKERRHDNPIPATITEQDRKRAEGLLEWAVERVANTGEGARNQTLYSTSYFIGTLVGGGFLTRSDAESALIDAGVACGLGKREAEKTVENGLNDGEENRQGLPDDSERRKQWLIEQGYYVEPLSLDDILARRAQGNGEER
jgi:hypothetical protein